MLLLNIRGKVNQVRYIALQTLQMTSTQTKRLIVQKNIMIKPNTLKTRLSQKLNNVLDKNKSKFHI